MRLIKGMTIAAASALVVAMSYGCSSTTTITEGPDTGTGTNPEAGGKDTSTGPKDSGNQNQDTSTGPTCAPVDVSSYKPGAYIPAAVKLGSCTHQNILDFDADCINASTASSSKCSTFQTANKSCVACLQTPDTAAAWGPLISHGTTTISNNIGGCIQLEGNMSCATTFQSVTGCDAAACDAVCPVMSGDGGASINALNACYQSADSGGCKMYSDALTACANDDGGPITTVCYGSPSDFDATFIGIAGLFCGYADGG